MPNRISVADMTGRILTQKKRIRTEAEIAEYFANAVICLR